MRKFLFSLCLLSGSAWAAQQPVAPESVVRQLQLTNALIGQWTGVLEYRDYSEPATSTKRVQLPTWLTISNTPEGLSADYVYDDGPSKTVTSHNILTIDLSKSLYRVDSAGHDVERYTISGSEMLTDGHGTLTLTGTGSDNDKPAELRETWTIRRNLLSWLEEVRPAGSSGPFVFRHRYTFTRAKEPSGKS